MRKIALLALLAFLAGCAAAPKPAGYGSFVTASDAIDMKMVDDTVKKLVTLYPPANTRFEVQHSATDPFGTSLVATLREQGYALQEHMSASTPDADDKGKSLTLAYVFDKPTGTDLYRVTLTIDTQNLSRVYLAKDGSVAPAGYWVRKE
ncbi:MAG: conjugal transfer protein TrbH [Massilia sp.]